MRLTDKLKHLDTLYDAVSTKTLADERMESIERSKDILSPSELAKLLAPIQKTASHLTEISAKVNKLSCVLQNPVSEQNTVVLTPQSQELLSLSFPLFLSSVASCADSKSAIENASRMDPCMNNVVHKAVERLAALSRDVSL